jgi:hypothetical protein
MKSILPLLFLLSTSFAHAAEWTQADTAREVAYQVVAAMDWAQTRTTAKHPEQWQELNVVLGKHPSVDRVNAYFAATGLAHYYISKALPADWRAGWEYLSIGFEGAVVAHNFHLGVRMDFP